MLVRNRTKVLSAVAAFLLTTAAAQAARPSVRGIYNFSQVNENLFRGGQPSPEGWRTLAKMGVQTVVDLRRDGEDHEHYIDTERRDVEAAGMKYVSIPMEGVVAPAHSQIARALAELNSGKKVFVHCREGKDRTGTVIACYRITHDRWPRKQAILEANDFGMHWYEVGLRQYVMTFREQDVADPHRASRVQPEPLQANLSDLVHILTAQQ